MQEYEEEVRALERATLAAAPAGPVVVFYGSSSIRRWSTLAEDFPGLPVINRGFGGSTLAACSWFFWRLVRVLPARSLVIYAGDNDLGDGQPPSQVLDQLQHLLQQVDLAFGPIPVGFISVKPSPARWHLLDEIREFNAGARERLEARPRGVFVDVAPLMIENGRPRGELYDADGLHLSPAGYRLWRDALLQHRVPLFEG